MPAFKDMPRPRSLVADAKLYCENNAAHLAQFGLITRVPTALKLVSQVITDALRSDTRQSFDDDTHYHSLFLLAARLSKGI
jgi:hypothetical protein